MLTKAILACKKEKKGKKNPINFAKPQFPNPYGEAIDNLNYLQKVCLGVGVVGLK